MSVTLPGKIIEEYAPANPAYKARNNRLGLVQFGDVNRPVFLDLLPEARVGDYVRVHVGYAVQVVSEEEAKSAYEELNRSGGSTSAEDNLEADESSPDMAQRQKQR